MDWGSLIGILLGIGGVLTGQLMEGGHLGSLIQPAAFVIVIIGTIGAVILQSGMSNFIRGVRLTKQVFFQEHDNYNTHKDNILRWATIARRDGFLALEGMVRGVEDPFLQRALRLIVDGTDPEKVRDLLETEINEYEAREKVAIKIWEAAGGYAPTIGIIGAVLGLIHVMQNLSDPSALGGGIAVAFVATIYGVGSANLIFLPIGNRLKEVIAKEVRKREMYVEAFYALSIGENPRMIFERLSIFDRV